MLQARCNSQTGKYQEGQDEESAYAHGPTETDLGDEVLHHKRKNYAT